MWFSKRRLRDEIIFLLKEYLKAKIKIQSIIGIIFLMHK